MLEDLLVQVDFLDIELFSIVEEESWESCLLGRVYQGYHVSKVVIFGIS